MSIVTSKDPRMAEHSVMVDNEIYSKHLVLSGELNNVNSGHVASTPCPDNRGADSLPQMSSA